jgi:hypothetical protein
MQRGYQQRDTERARRNPSPRRAASMQIGTSREWMIVHVDSPMALTQIAGLM